MGAGIGTDTPCLILINVRGGNITTSLQKNATAGAVWPFNSDWTLESSTLLTILIE